jgi:hypothetical protein
LRLSTQSCWEHMIKISYEKNPDAKPVPFGCKNCTEKSGGNSGARNTVVNSLLMLLSTKIYQLYCEEVMHGREKFLDMAYRQWEWFSSWFKLKEFSYLIHFNEDDTAALVPERPTAFFNGSDYQNLDHPVSMQGWIWSGDQGLLVGAFRELLAIKSDLIQYLKQSQPELALDADLFEKELLQYIWKIGNGIQKALIGKEDGIIREAPFDLNFGSMYGMDYLAGRGILVRFMGIKELEDLAGIDISSNIFATVSAIWAERYSNLDQFSARFTSEENDLAYIQQFEKLMGYGEQAMGWELDDCDMKDSVCQSIGMDFLRAAILLAKPS